MIPFIKMIFKSLLKQTLAFLILIFFLAATFSIWRLWVVNFLLVPDEPHQADCIVMLAGDNESRMGKAVELYRQHLAPAILTTPFREREKELFDYYHFENRVYGARDMDQKTFFLKAFANYFGKDEKGIYFTDAEGTSTFDEAVATKAYMLQKGWKSMILLTSGYHMRRTLMIFERVFRDTGIAIYPVTAPHPLLNPDKWWQRERDVKAIVLEYLSIIQNYIYHFLLKKDNTSFDTV